MAKYKRDMRLSNGLPVTVLGTPYKDGVEIYAVMHDKRNFYELLDGSEIQWLQDEVNYREVMYA
jgi:hypothetical protein